MKHKLLVICMGALSFFCTVSAQSLSVTGAVKGSVPADTRLYITPADRLWDNPDTLFCEGGKLHATTGNSATKVYKLIAVSSQRQLITPVSLNAKNGKTTLDIAFSADGNLDVTNANADTKALTAFNSVYTEKAKELWMKGKDMDNTALRQLMFSYTEAADSIIAATKPSAATGQYLRTWAAVQTFENLESIEFSTGHSPASLGIDMSAECGKLLAVADNDMVAAFNSAPRLALATVPDGTIADRIAALESTVKNGGLKSRTEDLLLSKHVQSFNYSGNYEEGLQELTGLTERFGLDGKYLNEFKVRKSSIAGTPFPQNVKLHDLDGKEVDFSKYRGKYVFIDLWASWCVPCIKEIPYLKELEKNLKNDNVCFLSISIDTKTEAWKNKVESLSLDGELLINEDNKLCEALNVSGIPFFLIYDKDGNLYKYNAPRPSDVRLQPLLESLK